MPSATFRAKISYSFRLEYAPTLLRGPPRTTGASVCVHLHHTVLPCHFPYTTVVHRGTQEEWAYLPWSALYAPWLTGRFGRKSAMWLICPRWSTTVIYTYVWSQLTPLPCSVNWCRVMIGDYSPPLHRVLIWAGLTLSCMYVGLLANNDTL